MSYFSYTLSRPYPYRWFTPVVVVGGIVVTVVVSIISVAISGFQLVAVTSTNPNETVASASSWFKHWPSEWGLHTTCETTIIPLNTELYTNNSAFSYTLNAVWVQNPITKQLTPIGSLPYHNNFLQNCSVPNLEITFEGLQRPAGNIAAQNWGAATQATITCKIDTPQGSTVFNLTTSYSYLVDDETYSFPSFAFIGRNKSSKASLYWGESMLQYYWLQLTNNVNAQNIGNNDSYYKGTAWMVREQQRPTTVEEVESLDFFAGYSWWLNFAPTPVFPGGWTATNDTSGAWVPISSLATTADGVNNPMPDIWYPADSLSKAMYYTILTDLGHRNSTRSNILTNPELLQYFTQNFTAIAYNVSEGHKQYGMNLGIDSKLAQGPYNSTVMQEYNLQVLPSTLATDYYCQTPQLKSGGSLLLAIVVADLVLLQAAWLIFKLCVDFFLFRRRPRMMYCEGCARRDIIIHRQGNYQAARTKRAGEDLEYGSIYNLEDDHPTTFATTVKLKSLPAELSFVGERSNQSVL